MTDTESPSPRRKRRAGIAVVSILLVTGLLLFVGMNFWYAEEAEETLPAGAEETAPAN